MRILHIICSCRLFSTRQREQPKEGGGKPGTGGWLECGEVKGRMREDSRQLNKKGGAFIIYSFEMEKQRGR